MNHSEVELQGDRLEKEAEVSGFDLTVGEDRALSALQMLLDKNDYQGNLPIHETTPAFPQAWRTINTTPAKSFTWTEYFESYGLKKSGGQYKGHEVENAKRDLDSLATKARRLVYKRRRWKKTKGGENREVYGLVVWKGTLIQIFERYGGLDASEVALVESGQDIKTRKHEVVVVFPRVRDLFIICIQQNPRLRSRKP